MVKEISKQDIEDIQKTNPYTIIYKEMKKKSKLHYAKCGHLLKLIHDFYPVKYYLVDDSDLNKRWCKFCNPSKNSS